MQNINPYNQIEFEKQFKQTDLYQRLVKEYDVLSFEKYYEHTWERMSTTRQQMSLRYISLAPWYYLQYLDWSTTVYDLGCGFNLFKKYFPDLIGISAEQDQDQFFADVKDFVDDEFYKNHQQHYQSVFSIDALHFHPLEDLRHIAESFSAMIAPGGTGFLALSYAKMQERSSLFDWEHVDVSEIEQWILDQFDNFPCELKVLDVDLSCPRAFLNGNIRVVFGQ
jgi:hypothetical protein